MLKRITLLERHDDITPEQFREHWATTHAEIAKDLPGVLGYRQNHVTTARVTVDDAAGYAVDGIVELWFEDEAAAGAGFASDVADRLIADEKVFLSGLTGIAVSSGGLTPTRGEKLWLLAQPSDEMLPEAMARWVADLALEIGATGHQMNVPVMGATKLNRSTLRHEEMMPEIMVSFGFETPDERHWEALLAAVERATKAGELSRAQPLAVSDLRIL